MTLPTPIFTELTLVQQLFVKNSYIKFDEKMQLSNTR
jgi:hypothetical protein